MNTPIDITDIVLQTERLVLRPWRQSDLDDFFAYASVDGVGQLAGWKPHADKQESQGILDRFIANKHTFALEYRGKVIGSLGIQEYDEAQFPEFADKQCRILGFALAKEHWGQGLMPEAVQAVVRYLFVSVGLDVILCSYFPRNRRSGRVQEKCGFKYYAHSVYTTHYDTTEEVNVNILTREDWLLGQNG